MLTKSQILSADPNQVLDLIEGWKRTVDLLEQQAQTYRGYVAYPGGSHWEGRTAEASQERAAQDLQVIANLHDTVHVRAQQISNAVTSSLMPPLSNAKHIICNADAQPGVAVHEDLSITYTSPAGMSDEDAQINSRIVADAEAELKESASKWWAAENAVAQQIREAQAVVGDEVNFAATDGHPRRHIQLVDHHWKQDPAAPQPPPDPVAALGLPDYNSGSLPTDEARGVYVEGELRIRQLDSQLMQQGLTPEQRARRLFDLRNSLRTWTRDIMSDRAEAAKVAAGNPNWSWEQLVEARRARGLAGDELYNSIIESSARSRASVNAAQGIDPEHPPPLPPVRPSAPAGGAGPAPAAGPHPAGPQAPAVEPPRTAPPAVRPAPSLGGMPVPLVPHDSPMTGPHPVEPPHHHHRAPLLGELPNDYDDGPE